MGIDPKVRTMMKGSDWCPEAWSDEPIYQRGGVLIFDLLTDMYRALGPKFDYTFTGKEACDYVYAMAKQPMEAGAARIAVFCCDLPELVPKRKGVEQKRRDRKRDTEPYPDGCVFSPEGLTGHIPGNAIGRFDIRRVMANRRLRCDLWTFIISQWSHRGILPPQGCTVVFDHHKFVHHVFDHKGSYHVAAMDNTFGEADLKVAYWTARLAKKGVHFLIRSIDSDLLPILLHTLDTLPDDRRPRITLKYWKENWCSINKIHAHLRSRGLPVLDFITFCVLCGTDYVDKSRIFHMIGCKPLFKYFENFRRDCAPHQGFDKIQDNIKRFVDVVRYVYGERWNLNQWKAPPPGDKVAASKVSPATGEILMLAKLKTLWQESDSKIAAKGTHDRQMQVPRADALHEVYEGVCFNLKYWLVDWSTIRRGIRQRPSMKGTKRVRASASSSSTPVKGTTKRVKPTGTRSGATT